VTIQITEAASLTATESKSSNGKVRYRARIIEAGQGSSAYYPAQVLEDYASVFRPGTQVYFDHPSMTEEYDRPERSVRDLVGKLVTEAEYDAAAEALEADVEFYAWAAPVIEEMKDDIGLSIRAFGTAEEGEHPTPTLTSFVEVASVDVVTRAGAGGKLLEMLESARTPYLPESTGKTKIKENSMTPEQEAKLDALIEAQTRLAESLTPVIESLAETAPEEVDRDSDVDALEAAKLLAASELSEAGQEMAVGRVTEGVTLAEAIEQQKAYEESIKESAGIHVETHESEKKPVKVSFVKVGA